MNRTFDGLALRDTKSVTGRVLQSLVAVVLALLLLTPAHAVRVDSVYSAEVDLPDGANAMQQAFNAALEQVLVKVSGLESLGNPTARRSLVPDSGQLVRQYSRLPGNRVRVEFDAVQLGRILDAAGQPVWGLDRPLIAIWYAIDGGAGGRVILAGGGDQPAGAPQPSDDLRDSLNLAADQRGLPVVFPLLDAEDLSRVSFSDIWGNFSEPVIEASARYGASTVLIGRARSMSPDSGRVRWTLVSGREQYSWESTAVDGPAQAATWLSQRLATYASSAGAIRVRFDDVDSLDKFGELRKYLRSLSVVQSAQVVKVQDDTIEFELQVRGDVERLSRSLESSALLEPALGGSAELVYRWAGNR